MTSSRARHEVKEICPASHPPLSGKKHDPHTKSSPFPLQIDILHSCMTTATSSWSRLLHRRQRIKKQGAYAPLSTFPSWTGEWRPPHTQLSLIATKIVPSWRSPRDDEWPLIPTSSFFTSSPLLSTPHFLSFLNPSPLLPFHLSETS